jgi:hypothetical protein
MCLTMITTKTTNSKIASKKVLLLAVTIIAAFIVSLTVDGVSAAAELEQIHAGREVSVPVDRLWNIIANVDDPKYWSQIHTMKVIKKAGNTIEADTTVGPQNSNSHEIITLHPKQSVITHITEGPVIGNRVITLSPLSENKTKIDALWSIDMPGIPFLEGILQKIIS